MKLNRQYISIALCASLFINVTLTAQQESFQFTSALLDFGKECLRSAAIGYTAGYIYYQYIESYTEPGTTKRLVDEIIDTEKLNLQYCCQPLKYLIEDPRTTFEYDPRKRLYFITGKPRGYLEKNEFTTGFDLTYCPICGEKFPSDLSDEWFKILENEYGVTDFLEGVNQQENVPQEYKTDEWWIKRGL